MELENTAGTVRDRDPEAIYEIPEANIPAEHKYSNLQESHRGIGVTDGRKIESPAGYQSDRKVEKNTKTLAEQAATMRNWKRICVIFAALLLLYPAAIGVLNHFLAKSSDGGVHTPDDGLRLNITDRILQLETDRQRDRSSIQTLEALLKLYANDFRDCSDKHEENGSYHIYPYGDIKRPVNVFCEFTGDGTWTVIQRRFDGSVNFTRNWREYKTGFGDANGEYWIGNDVLHQLTGQGQYELKIILKDWENVTKYFLYTTFIVADEAEQYKLGIGGYSGDADDGMATHNGMKFSTFDRDNSIWGGNCAMYRKGGWWYNACYNAI